MSKEKKYQDYVISNGILIGEWEKLYNDFEDPWMQSRHDHVFDSRRQLTIIACKRLREQFTSSNVLELGCGFGYITRQLADLNFNAMGIDISKSAIRKAKIKHPKSEFKVSKFNNFEIIYDFQPDIIIMAELTWYILEELEDFLSKLKTYASSRNRPVFLIHLLAVYKPGVQKFGIDKFTNHEEILDYFDLEYLESAYVATKRPDDFDSAGSWFVARIRS